MEKDNPTLFQRLIVFFKRRALTFLAGAAFAVLFFVGINIVMEPFSTPEFCGTQCHEMDSVYQAWKVSSHGANAKGLRAGCVDCHLPSRLEFFSYLTAKAYSGSKTFFAHHFGGDYDEEKLREDVLERMQNSKCISCHVDLLAKPDSDMAQEAHAETLSPSDASEQMRCVECHEGVGHEH